MDFYAGELYTLGFQFRHNLLVGLVQNMALPLPQPIEGR